MGNAVLKFTFLQKAILEKDDEWVIAEEMERLIRKYLIEKDTEELETEELETEELII